MSSAVSIPSSTENEAEIFTPAFGKWVLIICLIAAFVLCGVVLLNQFVLKPSPKSCAAVYGDNATEMQKTGKSACFSNDPTDQHRIYSDATCNNAVWVCAPNTCSLFLDPPGDCTSDQMICDSGILKCPS